MVEALLLLLGVVAVVVGGVEGGVSEGAGALPFVREGAGIGGHHREHAVLVGRITRQRVLVIQPLQQAVSNTFDHSLHQGSVLFNWMDSLLCV